MPGASNLVYAVYSGPVPSPVGQVVINEIMYDPAVANAQYVELYNNSTNTTFDLSGWEFHGLGYTFPAGSLIGPNSFLVLAANRADFAAAYGATNPVFDIFDGTLQADGETLSAGGSWNQFSERGNGYQGPLQQRGPVANGGQWNGQLTAIARPAAGQLARRQLGRELPARLFEPRPHQHACAPVSPPSRRSGSTNFKPTI